MIYYLSGMYVTRVLIQLFKFGFTVQLCVAESAIFQDWYNEININNIYRRYVVILGREDGHVLIMKLVPETHGEEGRLLITSRLDRARSLWEKATVAQSAIVTLDPLYQKVSKWVKDSELPKLGDDVRYSLQQKAKVISKESTNQNFNDNCIA